MSKQLCRELSATYDQSLLVQVDEFCHLAQRLQCHQTDVLVLVVQCHGENVEQSIHHLLDKGFPRAFQYAMQDEDGDLSMFSGSSLSI